MTIEVNLQVQLVNNLKEATLTKKTKRDIHAIAKKDLLLGLQFLYICAETRELVIVNATSKTKKKTDVNNYKLTAVTMHIIVYLLSGTLPEGIMYVTSGNWSCSAFPYLWSGHQRFIIQVIIHCSSSLITRGFFTSFCITYVTSFILFLPYFRVH